MWKVRSIAHVLFAMFLPKTIWLTLIENEEGENMESAPLPQTKEAFFKLFDRWVGKKKW